MGDVVKQLVEVAKAADLESRRDAMFAGEHINNTEDRAVLHTALRRPKGDSLVVDGVDVVADVHAVLARMTDLADRVRSGKPVALTDCLSGTGIDEVLDYLESRRADLLPAQ